ncbi:MULTISPECIES: GOLPH3/VPS74 family protein [Catenuloplanes]|uniref:GPP34 family phosphoprotein n=1 Tax=Catenuloplanes niger TaxID=587534 RepID=A0AAE3ZL82_9ACTN|nr:GPP34 family phosphoprotein [Catenuloplanes niger]MDR7320213.1 hypothetical protein [Catenuloplanes niger]
MDISLAEALVLLAYRDEDGTTEAGVRGLNHGVAAASLLELMLEGRIAIDGGTVAVSDATPTGRAVPDAVLARIAGAGTSLTPRDWLWTLAREDGHRVVLDRLVDGGVLERRDGRVLLVFPARRYPAPGGVTPPAEADVRARMRAAVDGAGPVDARVAVLCTLVGALGWDRLVFPDVPAAHLQRRLAELRDAPPVAGVVADVEAVVMVAAVLPAATT